jgi:hypothetical protein
MATKIENYDFSRRGRKEKYPWAEWLDGNVWSLDAGDDFTCTSESLRTTIYAAAKKRGVSVNTFVDDDKVIVQAIPLKVKAIAEAEATDEVPVDIDVDDDGDDTEASGHFWVEKETVNA